MKFHIEFDEKDIAKFMDKFGDEILGKFLEKFDEDKAIDKIKGDVLSKLLEVIRYDEMPDLTEDIHTINAMIDSTGTATMRDYIYLATEHNPYLKEVMDVESEEFKQIESELLAYGWNKLLTKDDIINDPYGYHIRKDSIVKLTEEQ